MHHQLVLMMQKGEEEVRVYRQKLGFFSFALEGPNWPLYATRREVDRLIKEGWTIVYNSRE